MGLVSVVEYRLEAVKVHSSGTLRMISHAPSPGFEGKDVLASNRGGRSLRSRAPTGVSPMLRRGYETADVVGIGEIPLPV